MSVLELAAFALSALSIVMLAVLVTRRWELARRERRRRALEERLKPMALELLHSGAEPAADLSADDKDALADVLGRYARRVTGATHARIVEYFGRDGTIEREVGVLAGARQGWRRATAAFRLGDIGSPAAVPGLVDALRDEDPAVRMAAARSLGRLRATEAAGELVAAAAERRVPDPLIDWALLQIGPPVLPELRSLLGNPHQRGRAAALRLIGVLGAPADAALVQDALRDSSALVRAQAARALGRLGGERHVPALLKALEDRIPTVRAAAATSLGYVRDPRALDPLAAHAERDQVFEVAREAARAVARIDPRGRAGERARSGGSIHLREAFDLVGLR